MVYEGRFGGARSNAVGVARRACSHAWNSGKRAVIAKGVAVVALRHARFLRMCFVPELQRLLLLKVECPRKYNPSNQQRNRKPKSEDETVPCKHHSSESSASQPLLEKNS